MTETKSIVPGVGVFADPKEAQKAADEHNRQVLILYQHALLDVKMKRAQMDPKGAKLPDGTTLKPADVFPDPAPPAFVQVTTGQFQTVYDVVRNDTKEAVVLGVSKQVATTEAERLDAEASGEKAVRVITATLNGEVNVSEQRITGGEVTHELVARELRVDA